MPVFRYFERLLPAFPDTPPRTPPGRFWPFMWACTEGTRGWTAAVMLLSAANWAFDATLFAMLGVLVDWLAQSGPQRLWADHGTGLAWMGAALVASIGIVALQTLLKHQTLAVNMAMRLRWNFHRLMLGQSLGFFQDEFAGRITTKVMQTALAVRDSVFTVTDVVVGVAVYFVTLTALAAAADPRLVLPLLAWLAAYLLSIWFFVPRLARIGRQQADARSMMTGRITDAYTNIATVKLFSHTQREAFFARAAMQDFVGTGYRTMRLVAAFEVVNHTLTMALIAGMAAVALPLWADGALGAGAVAAGLGLAIRIAGISHWVMWETTTLFEHVGTVQDGLRTLSKPRTVLDAPGAATLAVPRGEVRFEGVRFGYGGGRAVIDGLDLVVAPGEKIGLVGRSGAGKSTLVNLLLRFHDIDAGRIAIDCQDIAAVTQDSLRAQVGMVTQDTSLLHRSVRDNIAYGRPDASDAEILDAARQAEALPFIESLSDPQGRSGLDAQVGERGVKLSGGQRQRIAIARVMLKNAPILLLDEATSALDSEVEQAIQRSLEGLMQGKTVIAIAHRLSTIAAMDRLVVMDAGRIAEVGSHAELLAQGGLYARLWAHQSGGFLGEE